MTYILELNHINPNENLFFQTSSDPEHLARYKEYITPILKKHKAKGTWTNTDAYENRVIKYIQRSGTVWQRNILIYHFVSIDSATEFFQDLIADGTEYRRLLRDWQQEHRILAEVNILDKAKNVIEVIHACQTHKCMRFGSCPTENSGCATTPEFSHTGFYPVYHLDRKTRLIETLGQPTRLAEG